MKRIELRKDPDGTLDEVVVHNADLVHFEVMSDQTIWCGIDVGNKRVRIWINSKNGKSHIQYTAEVETEKAKVKP